MILSNSGLVLGKLWRIHPGNTGKSPLALCALILSGLSVGFVAGLVIAIFRITSSWTYQHMAIYFAEAKNRPQTYIALFAAIMLGALITAYLVGKYRDIRYGGMPWDEESLRKKQPRPMRSVLLTKFIGSWLVMASGISVGREGPSIQMGCAAALGLGQSEAMTPKAQDYYVYAGCSAGLSSAFSAPFTGVIFVFEKMRARFSWLFLIFLLSGALGMYLAVIRIGDLGLMLPMPDMEVPGAAGFCQLLPLGLFCGFIGAIYAFLVDLSKRLYTGQKELSPALLPFFPFIGAALMFIVYPLGTGEGLNVISGMQAGHFLVSQLIIFLIIKLIFTAFCYGSGIPAGLMVPVLCVGGVGGGLYHIMLTTFLATPHLSLEMCIVTGMAAAFAAAERAPLTGAILVLEMTGAFPSMPALVLCSCLGLFIATILRVRPA